MSGAAPACAEPLDRAAAALLELLGRDGESSLPRLGKRLGLSRSELQRLLLVLSGSGDDGIDGLGLVDQREHGGRVLVALSDRGRILVGVHR